MALLRFLPLCLIGWFALWGPAEAGEAHANIATTDRTVASLLSEVKAVHPSQKFWMVLHIKLQPGWHTYWKNPGDSGTPPAFTWTLPKGFKAGEAEFLAPERQKVGPLVDYGYSDDAYFLVPVTPPAVVPRNVTLIFVLKAEWLVCKDVCIPESGNLSLILPASDGPDPELSENASLVADLVQKLPVPAARTFGYHMENGDIHFDMPLKGDTSKQVTSAVFFPAQEGFITNAAEQKIQIAPDHLSFAVKEAQSALPDSMQGVVSFYLGDHEHKDYQVRLRFGLTAPLTEAEVMGSDESGTLMSSVICAFLGGLILNLMPCVFPILSLKCLAVARKSAAHPGAVRAQGFAYTSGVVISFLILAFLLIGIRMSGTIVGWGYQMQSPVFVAGLATLLFVVGLNLSGYFAIPTSLGNIGSDAAAKDTTYGSFMTGALAVVVATPCTAPFMASAIGFALTQNAFVIIAVFVALGLGLSAPFLLISLIPGLVSVLPRPGAWMVTFKQLLAFPMYFSVVWLLWVLTRQSGAEAVGIELTGLVLTAFALWLWQRDSSFARFAALLIVTVGLATVMAMVHAVPLATVTQNAHGNAESFSTARLKELRKSGKAVFVDATADWCITCKINETVALSSQKVMQKFTDKGVTYMIADWTHPDAEITRYLQSFGRSGVPLYVYYPENDGKAVVLPQILTESILLGTLGQ